MQISLEPGRTRRRLPAMGFFLSVVLSAALSAQDLREAPRPPGAFQTAPARRSMGLAVNRQSRADVVRFYRAHYLKQSQVRNDWSGSVAGCKAGSTGRAYQEATIGRVNYFRAMAGLPGDVELMEDSYADKNRHAALIYEAQGDLSHNPPSNWKCFSQKGKEGGSNSNIALGAAGPAAIDLYMWDPGSGNYFVGHRRWILYPSQQSMAPGSSARANALWVFGPMKDQAPATPQGVAWPPAGYVPHKFGHSPNYRWSFSQSGADFARASVVISHNGRNVPVKQERLVNGYGENTLVWTVPSLSGDGFSGEKSFRVKISGVRVGGENRTFEYAVTFIDPDASGEVEPEPAPDADSDGDTEDDVPPPPDSLRPD